MKIKIDSLEFEEKITVKQVLIKIRDGEISPSTGEKLFEDERLYVEYMLDVIKVCRTCGITPVFDDTPGEEQYSINMIEPFCEDVPIYKMIFRKLAEDIDYGGKDYFFRHSDKELPLIVKPEGYYEIVRIPYKSMADLKSDLEHVAIQITAQSKPELELDTLAAIFMENNKQLFGNQTEQNYLKPEGKIKKKAGKYPYIIHASVTDLKAAFPTHTHGLNKKGWPEFMIDPRCYGPEGNCRVINAAYDYFSKPKRRKQLNKILHGKTIEVPVNKLCKDRDWRGLNYPLCFRLVQNTFEAVKMAYDHVDGIDPNLVVAQIYVKGDDFALTDEYYRGGISY